MGLFARYHLFREVEARIVASEIVSFCRERGVLLDPHDPAGDCIDIHQNTTGWCVVSEPSTHRSDQHDLQVRVTRSLACAGFFIWVHDGDYFGYEFFHGGESIDFFVQDQSVTGRVFGAGVEGRGDARRVCERLSSVRVEDFQPYLRHFHGTRNESENKPARPGDVHRCFDELAVLDFLRMLGISLTIQDGYLRIDQPIHATVFRMRHRRRRSGPCPKGRSV